jgi:16S rRNA (guanine1207-N2)-methyltransferase
MAYLTDLYATVADKVRPPVLIPLGPPRPAAHLAAAVGGDDVTCFQFDLHQADKLRASLAELGSPAAVVTGADVWDLPPTFNTVLLPALAHADRELKIDMLDQGSHALAPDGLFVTLSEYERDSQFAKWHKKVFGKCSQTPASEHGMAFYSRKTGERERRRHEVSFHARTGGGPSMSFVSRPGVFSYGRFDDGSRALLEVADVRDDDHVLDLGSGVGAVGCLAATKASRVRVTFVDSSLRAAALSELNAKANGLTDYKVLATATLAGLGSGAFDAVLANPPYFGDSMLARLFVGGAKEVLRPGGRFYIVTKMPTAVVPQIFELFGSCDVIENRGYSIATAVA